MANFTAAAEKCSVWEILMKTCLVMVTMVTTIKLTQKDIGNCNKQNCFVGESWGRTNDGEWRTGQYFVEGVKAIKCFPPYGKSKH